MNKNRKNIKADGGKWHFALIGVALVIVVLIGIVTLGNKDKPSESKAPAVSEPVIASDLEILKKEIKREPKFFTVDTGSKRMEIIAVKASDGTIRTAFNTCQVCYGSPRAYYKQEGDVLVCQNCGNRFSMDMIEQQRGGCNPVPILKNNKAENNDSIIIKKAFIEKNSDLFTEDWKTQ